VDPDGDRHCNADAHWDKYGDPRKYRHRDGDAYPDSNCDRDRDGDGYRHRDCYTHSDVHRHRN
jgi:hypothetical protein